MRFLFNRQTTPYFIQITTYFSLNTESYKVFLLIIKFIPVIKKDLFFFKKIHNLHYFPLSIYS